MKRATVSLAVIAKDEIRNVESFFDSFAPAVDEIHFTDTGSTDGTIEFVTKLHHSNKYNIPIYLHHFKWVDDFSAARNFSFEQATCDYVLWADLDDCLNSAEKFVGWRDNVMHLADYWLATYNYALDKNGKSVCAFARERVVKRSLGFKWRYFVHEGILAVAKDGSKPGMQYATTWSIDHMRSDEDLKADRSRNLNLFAGREAELDPRMEYYYGKELFENKQPEPALKWLLKSVTNKDLELHDRILGMQYAVMAATQVEKFDQALQLAHQGMLLAPTRAEFYVLAGDILVKQRNLAGSIPFYHAATFCDRPVEGGTAGAIYTSPESSSVYPLNQLARVYFHTGSLDRARAIATDAFQRYGNAETRAVLDELEKLSGPSSGSSVQSLCPVEDILISCHPNGFYEWDEKIAQERGIGGSETAVVHMARHLHNLTGRKVFIFNNRDKELVIDGVHYKPFNQLGEYVKNFLPAIHIAWRHNNYLTPAPTYIWCHDLGFHGIEKDTGYSKILALSDFHSSFLQNMFAIKPERIHITRNGLDPKRFEGLSTDQKQHGKVVFSSSADRGLKRAILVMDEVVKKIPDATLHVYYGFDNMTRNGLVDQVKELQGMMCDRPYIHYHGNIQQDLLAKELSKAEVWLYPANFLETHCISALEALACKVYPVVRDWGALPFTLGASYNEGAKGDIVDLDCVTPEEVSVYAELTCNAICEKKWQSISVDLKKYQLGIGGEGMDILPPHIPKYKGSFNRAKCSKRVTQAYQSVTDQIARCYNPKCRSYRWYGAKGIRVMYDRRDFVSWWLFHIKAFKGKQPSISRLDHTKDYSFSNIRLEEKKENSCEPLYRTPERPWLTAKRRPVRMVCVKTGRILKRASHSGEMQKMTGVFASNIWLQLAHPTRDWESEPVF